MRNKSLVHAVFAFLILNFYSGINASAQYFGRNKVLYQNFDFRVLQTPHFEIYHYLDNKAARDRLVKWTEQWYLMHQQVLKDTFTEKNPFIIYNHHAHFQQTRAINSSIGVGTGGVTEALKNRVILPFMESNAQTDHVVGHELVHAFQYHLVKDSFSLNALSNLPLWMVEGMAEYMSIGYKDANTAMWLRSAVALDQLPSLKDLTNRPDLYFPYRWGEAFWAYVTGNYGDAIIPRLFMETARRGYPAAIKFLFGMDEKLFSRQWQESIRNAYAPFQTGKQMNAPGKNLVNKENAGEMNIVPSISPDGKQIAFWTEKNLFSIDLYIADASTGRITERITSTAQNSHIDQYSSYESSVAWSPDSRQLAYVAFAKGRNRLIISNTSGNIQEEIDLPGVSGFSNPAWSPDGKTIVVTALVQGQSDLYAYDLNTKKIIRLTNDLFADLQPSYSPDGKYIVFSTDRLGSGNKAVHNYSHNIALLELSTGDITNIDIFPGAHNLNPVFGTTSNIIFFLSDRDGFRNLYSYDINTKQVTQRTNIYTGIAGITQYAPAISVSRQTGQLAYSYFYNSEYTIFSAKEEDLQSIRVDGANVNMLAATLPPLDRKGRDMVQASLLNPPNVQDAAAIAKEVPYKANFALDYIGNTGMGIQTGGSYGTGLAGGVNGIFSDMLGHHQLYGAISMNGELVDVGGQFAYLNQKNRFNWGVSLSHIPYLSGAQYLFPDTVVNRNGDSIAALNYSLDLLRTFEDQLSVFGSYPFSTIRRIEAGATFARYYYRLDRYTEYYDPSGFIFLGNTKEKQDVPPGFSLGQAYVALVGDNSFFGVASPLAGHRFRLEAGKYLGVVNMNSVTADYRKYFRMAPVTLATRNMFLGRYGEDAGSGLLPPLFIGYPSLVRGYDALEYADDAGSSSRLTINDLIGSRMYVGNVELRFPFTGPERLSAIKSRFVLTELNLFTDGGIAWGSSSFLQPSAKEQPAQENSKFILSTGISLRLNLFGYLVIEPYYAIPWQNGGWSNKTFGVNILPGW